MFGRRPKTNHETVAAEARELLDQLAKVHDLIDKLNERERQIDAFFNLSRDIFMIVEHDTGTIVRINPRFTELLGWPKEQVVGRPFTDFVVPEDEDRSAARLKQIVRENRGDESTFVNRYKTHDGRIVTLDWRSAPPADGYVYAVARVVEQALTGPPPQTGPRPR